MKKKRKCSNISVKKYQNTPMLGVSSGTPRLKQIKGKEKEIKKEERRPKNEEKWGRGASGGGGAGKVKERKKQKITKNTPEGNE
jgi:hypothetical protein